MRYIIGHKARTKERIVLSAGKLFAAKGFDGTSIDEIMRDCNLTRGGFYAHFKSKSQLYRAAIELATSANTTCNDDRPLRNESDWIDAMLSEYLESDPARMASQVSRLTFLATDVASEDTEVRIAYASAFKAMSAQIASRISAHAACGEAAILSVTVMIVGARAIAQTIDDATLKEKLWASCRENAKALLENSSSAPLSFFWEAPFERDHLYMRRHNLHRPT